MHHLRTRRTAVSLCATAAAACLLVAGCSTTAADSTANDGSIARSEAATAQPMQTSLTASAPPQAADAGTLDSVEVAVQQLTLGEPADFSANGNGWSVTVHDTGAADAAAVLSYPVASAEVVVPADSVLVTVTFDAVQTSGAPAEWLHDDFALLLIDERGASTTIASATAYDLAAGHGSVWSTPSHAIGDPYLALNDLFLVDKSMLTDRISIVPSGDADPVDVII